MEDNENVILDGPTADATAGIGAEFESPFFYFTSLDCDTEKTNAAKGQVVAGRTGTNWELTADTGSSPGKVNAEYILNGKNIKVGSGDAAKAGKAIADDLVSIYSFTTSCMVLLTNVRSAGSHGWGTGQIQLTLRIANATRGRSKALPRRTDQKMCHGLRRSLRQCLSRLYTV